MPPLVVGAVVSLAAYASVKYVVFMALSYLLNRVFAPKAKAKGSVPEAQGRQHVIRSSIEPRRVIYGTVRVAGPLIYASCSGERQKFLNLVIALSGHESNAITAIYFNDVLVGSLNENGSVIDGQYASKVRINRFLGTTGQPADIFLMDEDSRWTRDHRGDGITYLSMRLEYDESVFPTGIPNVTAIVQGKRLYDPRTGLTTFSNNWALAIRDYLTSDYGLRCDDSEIDDDSFIEAANISDELVLTASGEYEARYTCDGTITLDMRRIDALEGLLSGGIGQLTYSQGKYKLFAAAYRTPVGSLDESDLAGGIKVRPRAERNSVFNGVRGTFVDPTQAYQVRDFPPVTNSTYQEQDGGDQIFKDIDLTFTQSIARSQRIAKIWLERSRQAMILQATFKPKAFKYSTMDNIYLSVDKLGFTNKVFTIVDWRMTTGGAVNMTLQEEASASYDWNSGLETVIDTAPNTNLPDPWTVGVPGLPSVSEELYETTGSAGVKARAVVSWGESDDIFVNEYVLEYMLNTDSVWSVLASTRDTSARIDDISPGIYLFRVKARNGIGVLSEYTDSVTAEIRGLTAPPADVSNFSLMPLNSMAMLSWDRHPDLDVLIGGKINIRYSSKTSGAIWEDGIPISEPFQGGLSGGFVPLLAGTYMAKAVDSGGRFSIGISSVVTTAPNVITFNAVATSTQSPTFPGTKTNLEVASSKLQLGSIPLIDDVTDLADDWLDIDSLGRTDAYTGTYLFDNHIDLGAVYTSRVTADVESLSVDNALLIDGRTEDIDSWDAVDGDAIYDAHVSMYMRTTDDDPAGTPTWSEWKLFNVGDYITRAYDFKLEFVTLDTAHNIEVSNLAVSIDMPDRLETGNVTTGTGAVTTVTYTQPFKAAPKVGLTIKDMAVNDVIEIVTETASNFTFNIRNGGARVARSVNWIVKSY